jgi:hypothetical protein
MKETLARTAMECEWMLCVLLLQSGEEARVLFPVDLVSRESCIDDGIAIDGRSLGLSLTM